MGSSLKKQAQDQNSVNLHIEFLRRKYQSAKDLKSFLKHLSFPTEPIVVPNEFEIYSEENFKSNLYNFGVLFYYGLCSISYKEDGINFSKVLPTNSILSEEQYVKGMYYLVSESGVSRLQFILRLYVSYMEERQEYQIAASDIIDLLWHAIALADFVYARETKMMKERGYLTSNKNKEEEQVEEKIPERVQEPTRHRRRVKELHQDNVDVIYGDTLIPEKAKVECNLSYAVPKYTKDAQHNVVQSEKQHNRWKKSQGAYASVNILIAIVNSMFAEYDEKSSNLSLKKAESWFSTYVPELETTLQNLIRLEVLGELLNPTSAIIKQEYNRLSVQPVPVDMEYSNLWNPIISWTFRNFLDLGRVPNFKLLYNSSKHGHSLNRLIHHVLGYTAPTLLIVLTEKKFIFGLYMNKYWMTSCNYIGDSNCVLWGLAPIFAIRRALRLGEEHFAYLYVKKHMTMKYPVGIGIGGSIGNFRVSIQEDLMSGMCYSNDNTYERGPICPDYEFSISAIEVWGCGSEEASRGIEVHRSMMEKNAKKSKAINTSKNWKTGPDKYIFDMLKNNTYHDYIPPVEDPSDRSVLSASDD
ncbi:uncharacterized protein LOC126320575 [Schistocerca gregaria]|uniref:uncharacterized protein LOC126320575 n=1 Tax=Schistocerca gregaria TaxID=7010 RepID=UPI00211F3B61|nr:uncharacterized protein LOC126320575 [Schistocerca gregaria]